MLKPARYPRKGSLNAATVLVQVFHDSVCMVPNTPLSLSLSLSLSLLVGTTSHPLTATQQARHKNIITSSGVSNWCIATPACDRGRKTCNKTKNSIIVHLVTVFKAIVSKCPPIMDVLHNQLYVCQDFNIWTPLLLNVLHVLHDLISNVFSTRVTYFAMLSDVVMVL